MGYKKVYSIALIAFLGLGAVGFFIYERSGQLRSLADVAKSWPSLLAVTGIAVILLLWIVPKWQVARSTALTDDNRFDRENEARKTLAQILAGIFVLTGLYSSLKTFDLSAKTLDLSREGQITDRFTKALEQLGALDGAGKPKLEVRLGGIYAVERIARDSEKDHRVIMEVLTAYVREHSPRKEESQKLIEQKRVPGVGADIQAILTVLGRREPKYDKGKLNLAGTDLRGADLSGAYLSGANLNGADLGGVNLSTAQGLVKAQIDSALLDKDTQLPPMRPPERWEGAD